jgi:hypothetical protein
MEVICTRFFIAGIEVSYEMWVEGIRRIWVELRISTGACGEMMFLPFHLSNDLVKKKREE